MYLHHFTRVCSARKFVWGISFDSCISFHGIQSNIFFMYWVFCVLCSQLCWFLQCMCSICNKVDHLSVVVTWATEFLFIQGVTPDLELFFLWLNLERTLDKRCGKTGVVRRRQLKRSSLSEAMKKKGVSDTECVLVGSRWRFCVNMGFSDKHQISTENVYIFKSYGVKTY